LDYKGSWVYVAYKKHKGYVKAEYLSFTPPVTASPPVSTPAPAGGDGGQTATQGASLRLGDRGESVRELQRLLTQAGCALSADGVFGNSTQEALIAFQKRCGLTADGLAGSRTMSELRLSAQAAQAPTAEAPTRAPDSALRLNDQGEAVRELQKLLADAGYSVSADGVFGENTEKAVLSFQMKIGLTADGLAGRQTIEGLRNPSAGGSAATVELLSWWNGGSKAFPVGAKATVVDVRTGIRFTVKRWGGVNHADVEPASQDDTAAMKKAYGGAWSWNRRPIWVLVNGRAIAASMNGMPHMGYSLSNNSFPGHFCIHMKDSRLHAGNRVDPEHAAAVNEAYNKRGNFK
jgi:peptidoglycan hydrolase-like protein with peptidoglycan-binding domain